ncbi:hypothetical protein Dsin_014365 [Dipteronia sinensis]|uniref:DUF4220 domain-containing protein n=1 Tax=Dipteronia sinensis TaxID=43782 RepID=A0AAE0AMS0_9ROSI|nr:hypothetical protein Dsin_014365 [Dipteronia sinensis]
MENGRHGFLDQQPARNIKNPTYYYRDSRLHIPGQIKSEEDTLLFAKHLLFISSHAFLMVQSVSTCSFKIYGALRVLVDKHKYSKFDLSITYLLIVVAAIHDIYAALLMVLSDAFAAWLIKYKKHSIFKALNSCTSTRRWSNNINKSQYSLLISCATGKVMPVWESFLFQVSSFISFTGNYWHCEVSGNLRKLIFMYVNEKAQDAETSRRQWRPPFTLLPSTIGIREQHADP